MQIVDGALPDTWIYIVSINPSKLRWSEWPRMKAATESMQKYAATQMRVQYIDVATSRFDADGNLPRDLLKFDGLHPTAKLYAMWTAIIKPILLERFGPGNANPPIGVTQAANREIGVPGYQTHRLKACGPCPTGFRLPAVSQ